MSDPGLKPRKSARETFTAQVGTKASRRLKARRHKPRSVWTGFAFFGLVGWSVVAPTLIGAAIGLWLDRHHPGERSWTLVLMVAGLVLGCINAWRWIEKEHREIKREHENDNDE
ncbi:AtpZ/AtpI family protein [Verrucomicrobiota bacterium sgz303538]